MPFDCGWEEAGFFKEFLEVVFAEVKVTRWGAVEGQDV